MFGLGHYIYAGEDLPQDDNSVAEKLATPKKAEPKKTAPKKNQSLKRLLQSS